MYRKCGFLGFFREPCRDADEACYERCHLFGGGVLACKEDEFRSTDGTCTQTTKCAEGEYETRKPSATSDRVCKAGHVGCAAGDPGCQCFYRTPCRGRMTASCRRHTSCRKNLPGNWRRDPWAPGHGRAVLTEADAEACLSNARAPKFGRFGAWMKDCNENAETGTRLAMSSAHAKNQKVNFDGTVVN